MSVLPQQDTIDQYVADGVEVDYIYSFLIPSSIDIAVYVTPAGEDPNPTEDIQALNVDYTVTGTGNTSGGVITFTVAPALGDVVTLSRNIRFSIDTNFASAQTISGVNLDNAFQRVTLMAQQLNSFYQFRGLQYVINTYIPDDETPTRLPLLESGQIWQGSAGGAVIAVDLEEDPNVSTLRGELASESQGGDGAELIGYYDEYFNEGNTLAEFLNGLPAYIEDVVTGLVPTIGYQTGDIKPSMNATALSGWIVWQNGSIGSAASGAGVRANADTQSLFELLWNNCSNAICPVSGGRGANATADFVANKTIDLPLTDGRILVNLQSTYSLGETFGEDEITLSIAEMPAHDHPGSIVTISVNNNDSGNGHIESQGLAAATATPSFNLNISSQGGGNPHENRQPSTAVYYHVKL